MADIFKTNRDAFRGAILFQIKLKVSVEEAFKAAKIVLEDDALDFIEFEYLYYKLYNKPEANFSADFTNRASHCKLETLPPEMINEVVQNLDAIDQLNVRKVSRKLRKATATARVKYNSLVIECYSDCVLVVFNQERVAYMIDKQQGCQISHGKKRISFPNENYFKIASIDLNVVLSNPNFSTNMFSIDVRGERLDNEETIITTMENIIANGNLNEFIASHLNVSFTHEQHLRRICGMFNKTALKKLSINSVTEFERTLNSASLSQFEQLKSIEIRSTPRCKVSSFDVLAKCKDFTLHCQITEREFAGIVNNILASDQFKRGYMIVNDINIEILRTFLPNLIIKGNTFYLKFQNIPFWLQIWGTAFIINLRRIAEDEIHNWLK